MARPNWFLGAFALLLLILSGMQIYENSFRLDTGSLAIIVLLFGVIIALSYPDIIRFKVGPSGFEFERRATELTQKLLVPSGKAEGSTRITTGVIEVRHADFQGELLSTLVEVEREMTALAKLLESQHYITGWRDLIQFLYSKKLLDKPLYESLEFLRTIRNSAFHGENLSDDQTRAALQLATIVLDKLKSIRPQRPNQ